MVTAFIIIASVLPVVFIVIQLKKGGAAGTVAKTAASLGFVILGAAEICSSEKYGGIFILLALVFGLVGDIFLGVYNPDDKSTDLYMPAGMLSFAIEHFLVVYAVGSEVGLNITSVLIAVAVGVLCTAAAALVELKLMKFEFGKLLLPSLAYMFVLTSAMSYYVTALITDPKFLIVVIGMGFFLISDLVLSAIYFGGKRARGIFTAVNLTTYYAGQILFAASIGITFGFAQTWAA